MRSVAQIIRASSTQPRVSFVAVGVPRTVAPRRAYSLAGSDRIDHVQPKSFFAVNERLAAKRSDSHRLLHLFLEGAAGSGKNAILYKLQNMGYSVNYNQYYKLFAAQAKVETRDNPQFRFEVNRQFCNKINDSILKAEDEYKKGQAFRSNVVVHSRSLISPYVYTQSPFFLDWMREINKLYNVAVVICNADIIQVQVRLAERESSEKQSTTQPATLAPDNRTFLGEMNVDFLRQSAAEYTKLLASPFDEEVGVCSAIHTTSTKQGTAALMTQLGLKYQGFESKA